ncbi:MAG: hypothetical protein IAE86_06860 [Burkholderiaceae bacterium]|nr:hypothetical protein [Burkholderiaceae bacterium]
MSQAITALLLLRLEARRGEWVPVADLGAHLALHEQVVRAHLVAMESAGKALLRRGGGGVVQAASSGAAPERAEALQAPNPRNFHLERNERPYEPAAAPSQRPDQPRDAA